MTTSAEAHFVRQSFNEPMPPPMRTSGIIHWLRTNLFSSIINTVMTLFILFALYKIVPGLIDTLIINAVWVADDSKACVADKVGHPVGICWGFVAAHWDYFVFGQYPEKLRWRPELFFAVK